MAGEFDLIRRYAPKGAARKDVVLGSGDDAALLEPPAGKQLVATVDTLVAGRHFPLETAAYDVGWKALSVNLSDLAAMGAEAAWVTVALSIPKETEEAAAASAQDTEAWMADFCDGIQQLAEQTGVAVVGGDLTSGPLSVTIQALGHLQPGTALRRDAAKPGDVLAVTGCLGDAALALQMLQAGQNAPAELLARLNRPTPRLVIGQALAGRAHAAIDVSDGLLGDVQHILQASAVGARIHAQHLPASTLFNKHCPVEEKTRLQLTGGDDYELCICLPAALAEELADQLTVVGEITAETGIELLDEKGQSLVLEQSGYDHFAA